MALNINGTTGISGVDGSASAPAVQGTDSNTGINFGTDTVNINTGGVTRATVDSSGRVGIGTTSPSSFNADGRNLVVGTGASDSGMSIYSASGNYGNIYFADGTSDGSYNAGGILYNHSSNFMRFDTAAGERMRINSSGNLTVGTTNDDGGGSSNTDDGCVLRKDGLIASRMDGGGGVNSVGFTAKGLHTGGYTAFRTMSAQTQVGSITFSSGGTAFNTSSDYRRKENIVSLTDAITRLKTLLPKRFNFINEPSVTIDGFLAHEVTAVPEAVNGTKDAVATAEDVKVNISENVGDPIYQQLDQSKLVPLLTAALQEAIAKIEVLETKVAALEAG